MYILYICVFSLIYGTLVVKQLQQMHVVGSQKISLPERTRKNYPGSTAGDLIQDITCPDLDSQWHLPWSEKKKLLTKKHIIAVGGKTDGIDGSHTKRTDQTLVPVTYYPLPPALYEEMVYDFYIKHAIDLTPIDALLAFYMLVTHGSYVGICYSEEHADLMDSRLKFLVKEAMGTAGHKLFNASFAKALGGDSEHKTDDNGDNVNEDNMTRVKSKNKAKGKAKGKAKAKAKANATVPEEEGDDEAVFSGDDDDDAKDDEIWDPFAEEVEAE